MKIHLCNPNTTASMTEACALAGRAVAAPSTEIVATNPADGPVSIESQYDSAWCVPGLLDLVRREEAAGADAHIVACFRDPGLEACREISRGPVLGIAEAAMHAASLLGRGFTILTTLPRSVPVQEGLARKYGFGGHLRSVRPLNVPVLELEDPTSAAADKVIALTKMARDEDGADCVLLGCAGLVDLAKRVSDETGVVVLDGVVAAVKMAEALVGAGYKTAKAGGYAAPRPKPYTGKFTAAAPE
ncbi:MAG: aspartate/glutamate racemase family protein [Alphaproteobacteria bacterium]|nr:aspartate/glutamate racemase family protein [Alphaproteobacteria bacterium]